ncbi:MAG: hypothetical protein ACYTFH_02260 [Planctomycetota bacterium]|jgi:hypothetical protein
MTAIRSPHRSALALAATIAALLGPVACRTQPDAPPAAAETTPVVTPSADPAAPSSPHGARDVQELMQAKLLLAGELVNGLAVGDLVKVAESAEAMRALSERASWRVQETVTYVALGEVFRSQLDRLAADARAGNREALVGDYVAVTNTCLACHRYLDRERRDQDMPGRLSRRSSLLERLAIR